MSLNVTNSLLHYIFTYAVSGEENTHMRKVIITGANNQE